MFQDLFDIFRSVYFYISAILFLVGIYSGPLAVDRNIRILLKYPRWMIRLMEKYFRINHNFLAVFLIIFSLNNLSLFSSFLSGFLVILPPFAAFLTGFHVAVISYEMMHWRGIWFMLVNPVAWLEFPAAWISFTLGFKLSEAQLQQSDWSFASELFQSLTTVYFKYVFPLLLFAAILETAMIVLANRFGDGE